MKSNRMMFFTLSEDEVKRVEDFMQEHQSCGDGLFGGRYEFTFLPCPHGMPKTVTCICGKTLYLDPKRN